MSDKRSYGPTLHKGPEKVRDGDRDLYRAFVGGETAGSIAKRIGRVDEYVRRAVERVRDELALAAARRSDCEMRAVSSDLVSPRGWRTPSGQ